MAVLHIVDLASQGHIQGYFLCMDRSGRGLHFNVHRRACLLAYMECLVKYESCSSLLRYHCNIFVLELTLTELNDVNKVARNYHCFLLADPSCWHARLGSHS